MQKGYNLFVYYSAESNIIPMVPESSHVQTTQILVFCDAMFLRRIVAVVFFFLSLFSFYALSDCSGILESNTAEPVNFRK